ncbi:MAG: hypothetical protein FWH40_10060 [Coriobacteriia bacterium]|nr:hypothetical protein [Coriobacteriia bacterium]
MAALREYYLHDSLIDGVLFLPDEKRVEIRIELCNWMQPGFCETDPETLEVCMVFEGVEEFSLSLAGYVFDYDEILEVRGADDGTIVIAYLATRDVATISIKGERVMFIKETQHDGV